MMINPQQLRHYLETAEHGEYVFVLLMEDHNGKPVPIYLKAAEHVSGMRGDYKFVECFNVSMWILAGRP